MEKWKLFCKKYLWTYFTYYVYFYIYFYCYGIFIDENVKLYYSEPWGGFYKGFFILLIIQTLYYKLQYSEDESKWIIVLHILSFVIFIALFILVAIASGSGQS